MQKIAPLKIRLLNSVVDLFIHMVMGCYNSIALSYFIDAIHNLFWLIVL